VLRDLEGLDTEETATLLGVEVAAVRQRLHRARLMLRARLTQLVGGDA
jgi:RNA polymerase sigma-70 factor (ECF subfamily)